MFLFSFVFYSSPLFVEADTTVWTYTMELAGVQSPSDPFKGVEECNVALSNYKKTPLALKTTPCKSSILDILGAVKPTMEVVFVRELPSKTSLYAWELKIKTTGLPFSTTVAGSLYTKEHQIIEQKIIPLINNSAVYTTGAILENNKEYKLVLTAIIDNQKSIDATFIKTVGKTDSVSTTREVVLPTSNPVPVTPKTDTPVNSGVYNLLAPIGGMDTAPNDMGDYFNKIFLIIIGLCGALAVVMLIIGGIQYMGEDSIFGKTEAKKKISSAILGLAIALCAYALLNTINPDLLGKGVALKQLIVEIQDEVETSPWEGSSVGDNTTLCPGGYGDISTSWGDATHKKINVCKTIIPKTNEMILAAKEAGFLLTGSGSRNLKEQTDKWNEKKCNPPGTVNCSKIVAKPGTSMHESGFAIDFRCDNKVIGKQEYNNRCVVWLAKNAINYGFKNLPGEAWHWSTGPKAGH